MVTWTMNTRRYPRPVTRESYRRSDRHPAASLSSRSRIDMLRETCPEDFEEIEPEMRPAVPSAWVLFGAPLGICTGVVLLAWLHVFLGMPLGAEWAAKLWSLAESAIFPTVAATAFSAYVRQKNEHALRMMTRGDLPPDASGADRLRRRQTGPYRVLGPGPRAPIEAEVMPDEEDGPW